MTNTFLFSGLFEILMAVFILWGLFHEEKLAELEDKLLKICKAAIRRRRAARHRKLTISYSRKPSGKLVS